MSAIAKQIDALTDRIATLEAALKPFAECCDAHGGVTFSRLDDMTSVGWLVHKGYITITGVSVGDIRRARAALAAARQEGGEHD